MAKLERHYTQVGKYNPNTFSSEDMSLIENPADLKNRTWEREVIHLVEHIAIFKSYYPFDNVREQNQLEEYVESVSKFFDAVLYRYNFEPSSAVTHIAGVFVDRLGDSICIGIPDEENQFTAVVQVYGYIAYTNAKIRPVQHHRD